MNYEQKAEFTAAGQKNLLTSSGYAVSGPVKGNYCFEITVSKGKEKLKILNYFSRTGNKVLLQGNKESGIYEDVYALIFGDTLFSGKEEYPEPDEYIGTDESGKGDFFGPLIIAGVFVNGESSAELKKAGVKDSKLFSDYAIRKMEPVIKNIAGNNYNIVSIHPERYNTLYEQFNNLNRLLGWGHARVLENILTSRETDTAISDKFGDERFIIASLQAKGRNLKLLQFPKAEKYTAVAAASVLARGKMLDWFDAAEKKYGVKIPKGASALVETAAREIKTKMGKEVLDQLIKKHFKTTQKL